MVTIDTIKSGRLSGGEIQSPRGKRLSLWGHRVLKRVARWWMIRSTRRQLVDLDDVLLRDIGVTRQEARTEAKRSIHLLF